MVIQEKQFDKGTILARKMQGQKNKNREQLP